MRSSNACSFSSWTCRPFLIAHTAKGAKLIFTFLGSHLCRNAPLRQHVFIYFSLFSIIYYYLYIIILLIVSALNGGTLLVVVSIVLTIYLERLCYDNFIWYCE